MTKPSWIPDELGRLREEGLLRKRRCVIPLADGWCEIDGKKRRNFAANDYLDLARDRRLIEAAREALERAGAGSTASALVTGRTDWHATLEERLAGFEGQEAAVLFSSGYATNVGTIAALTGSDDVVFSDRLNHASLVDGCRLSGAVVTVYQHDRLEELSRGLEQSGAYRSRLIVTDSLFSMDGHVAPLKALCDLAEQFDATLLVDEAHATGIYGRRGRGVAEALNVEDRVAVRTGTLSKSLGSLGGFVAGSQALVDWLWNQARTHMFSTSLPPSACAAATAAIEIVSSEPWRRERLFARSEQLRSELSEAGLTCVPHGAGPIVPVILNDPDRAVSVAERLETAGFLVAAIRPPTVPEGTSRLRITLSCAHTPEDVSGLVTALSRIVTST